MQFGKSEAILLDVRDLGEYDRIVVSLTRERGKLRGVARSARRKYSRFSGHLQPLARCEIRWHEKEGLDLVRIDDVTLLAAATRLQSDLEGVLLGCYLADQVDALAPENQVDDRLYRLLASTLEAFDDGVDRSLALRYFEVWSLRLSGVFPRARECPACGGDLRHPTLTPHGEMLVCGDCAEAGETGGERLTAATESLLHAIGKHSLPGVAAEKPPSRAALDQLERVSAAIRRHFLERELKSYEVMKRTLAAS